MQTEGEERMKYDDSDVVIGLLIGWLIGWLLWG
jgi:hypothetical protein